MKPSAKSKDAPHEALLSNADELIREVTEHVAAHSVPMRRPKKRKGTAGQSASVPLSAPPVTVQSAPPAAAPVIQVRTPAIDPAPKPASAPAPAAAPAPAPVLRTPAPAAVTPPPAAAAMPAPVAADTSKPAPAVIQKKSETPVSSAAVRRLKVRTLAVICHDEPAGLIGAYAASLSEKLAQMGYAVHIFSRRAFPATLSGIRAHELGECAGETLLASAQAFAQQVQNSFTRVFGSNTANVAVLGLEWTSIPALLSVRGRCAGSILSLHSLERQRSDMRSDLSQKIHALEMQGLREAGTLLIQQTATLEVVRKWAPEVSKRIVTARHAFPVKDFACTLDQGEIKKRYQVGPVDPLVLFIGPLDERHGPDLLMKSAPQVLKQHRQTRFAFVGDGKLQWPLRVHSRYLLLDYAVRMLGHMSGQNLHELIHGADIIAVPSRERTTEWPVLAAWAAHRPVVATHNAASGLVQHDQDGLLVYPNENSLVWGLDKLIGSHELRTQLSQRGQEKLKARYGWDSVAVQITELMQAFAPENEGKDSK